MTFNLTRRAALLGAAVSSAALSAPMIEALAHNGSAQEPLLGDGQIHYDDPAVRAAMLFRASCKMLLECSENTVAEEDRELVRLQLDDARAALAIAVPTTALGAACLIELVSDDLGDGVDEDWQLPALRNARDFLQAAAGVDRLPIVSV